MAQRSKYTIRTSDRRVFRRCLRKWNFQSSIKGNWKSVGAESNIHFWFGSAIHFAMEDFHGENKFKDPRRAFWAYNQAFKAADKPAGADSYYELGMAMLSYYMTWYPRHNDVAGFETAYVDADHHLVPKGTPGATVGVEQGFYIPLNVFALVEVATDKILRTYWGKENIPEDYLQYLDVDESFIGDSGIELVLVPLMYHGTMDRIVIDRYGRYWILDYKTAKGADTNKLDTDDQISAYLWAFEQWYGVKAYGFVYLQLTKDPVKEPKRLKSGDLSIDKKQKTTYSLVKQEIIRDYGKVTNAPDKMIQFLNHMAEQESPEGDRFIRWDFVKRTPEQLVATGANIVGELQQMLNPNLYFYPSPTRDCMWDCPCRTLCLAMEMGDQDTVDNFMLNFEQRPHNEDGNIEPWRDDVPWPKEGEELIPLDSILMLDQCMKIELESKADDDDNGFTFMYESEEEC